MVRPVRLARGSFCWQNYPAGRSFRFAYAFSRNHVLEKTWDKTTIPLPFGRSTIVRGDPVWVDADADDVQLEEKRVELTRQLNRATDRAYAALEKAK